MFPASPDRLVVRAYRIGGEEVDNHGDLGLGTNPVPPETENGIAGYKSLDIQSSTLPPEVCVF